jgi:transposase-like protein
VNRTKLTILKSILGWSWEAVVKWCGHLREVCALTVSDSNKECGIGGPGVIVEIDESKFGKRKYNRGHRVEGCWVFGGIERLSRSYSDAFPGATSNYAGKKFAIVVENRSARTLLPLIRKFILPGSIIMSDCWAAYNGIRNMDGCHYEHETVNHSENYVDGVTGACTNTIESDWWAGYKRHIPKTAFNKSELQGYLFEQMWRKENEDDLWFGLLRMLASTRYHTDEL